MNRSSLASRLFSGFWRNSRELGNLLPVSGTVTAMLKNIEVEHFRLFKQLSVKKLKRFNLITGRNASGKTTFLESLFLNAGAGNPDLVFAINSFRGDQVLHAESDRPIATCFYEMNSKNVVRISCEEERQKKHGLVLSLLTLK